MPGILEIPGICLFANLIQWSESMMSGSVAVVIVAMIMSPMGVVVFRGIFGKTEPAVTSTGELNRTGEEHQADQSRDVDGLTNEIADPQTEQIVVPASRRPDCSPDEDGDQPNQDDSDPAPFTENIAKLEPIHSEGPEDDPGEEWNPGEHQETEAEDDILQGQDQVCQCCKQVLHEFLKLLLRCDL